MKFEDAKVEAETEAYTVWVTGVFKAKNKLDLQFIWAFLENYEMP